MNRRYFLVTTIFIASAATFCILLATASGADVSLVPDANQR
jgi:hypothetical protein